MGDKTENKSLPRDQKQRTGKGFIYEVVLLDGEHVNFELDRNAEGRELFDKVCQHLDLSEKDYFGLQYVDERLSNHLKCWLSPEKKINKQKKGGPWLFDFALKFYPPDPTQLRESLTRWLVTLQVRRDVLSGRLPATFLTQAMLGSYNVQADLGDYDPNDHHGIMYVRDIPFTPNQTPELLEKIVELHKQHKGQTPDEAEINFLENAKKLAMYGVDLHAAQDVNNVDIMLGVCASGLQVYREKLRISRFVWPKILKLSYKRKHFYVKVRPTDNTPGENSVCFKLQSHRLAKRLWKISVEHHAFFRLREVDQPQNSALFPRLGSKFRYSGRTLYQTRQNSQILDRPDPYFERSQPARNKSQSVDELSNRPDYWKDDPGMKKKRSPSDNLDENDRRDWMRDPNSTLESGQREGMRPLGQGGVMAPGDRSMDGKDRRDHKPGQDDDTLNKDGTSDTMGLTPSELKKAKEEEKERKKREKDEEKRRKKEEEDEKKKAKKGKGKDGSDPTAEDRRDHLGAGDNTENYPGGRPGTYGVPGQGSKEMIAPLGSTPGNKGTGRTKDGRSPGPDAMDGRGIPSTYDATEPKRSSWRPGSARNDKGGSRYGPDRYGNEGQTPGGYGDDDGQVPGKKLDGRTPSRYGNKDGRSPVGQNPGYGDGRSPDRYGTLDSQNPDGFGTLDSRSPDNNGNWDGQSPDGYGDQDYPGRDGEGKKQLMYPAKAGRWPAKDKDQYGPGSGKGKELYPPGTSQPDKNHWGPDLDNGNQGGRIPSGYEDQGGPVSRRPDSYGDQGVGSPGGYGDQGRSPGGYGDQDGPVSRRPDSYGDQGVGSPGGYGDQGSRSPGGYGDQGGPVSRRPDSYGDQGVGSPGGYGDQGSRSPGGYGDQGGPVSRRPGVYGDPGDRSPGGYGDQGGPVSRRPGGYGDQGVSPGGYGDQVGPVSRHPGGYGDQGDRHPGAYGDPADRSPSGYGGQGGPVIQRPGGYGDPGDKSPSGYGDQGGPVSRRPGGYGGPGDKSPGGYGDQGDRSPDGYQGSPSPGGYGNRRGQTPSGNDQDGLSPGGYGTRDGRPPDVYGNRRGQTPSGNDQDGLSPGGYGTRDGRPPDVYGNRRGQTPSGNDQDGLSPGGYGTRDGRPPDVYGNRRGQTPSGNDQDGLSPGGYGTRDGRPPDVYGNRPGQSPGGYGDGPGKDGEDGRRFEYPEKGYKDGRWPGRDRFGPGNEDGQGLYPPGTDGRKRNSWGPERHFGDRDSQSSGSFRDRPNQSSQDYGDPDRQSPFGTGKKTGRRPFSFGGHDDQKPGGYGDSGGRRPMTYWDKRGRRPVSYGGQDAQTPDGSRNQNGQRPASYRDPSRQRPGSFRSEDGRSPDSRSPDGYGGENRGRSPGTAGERRKRFIYPARKDRYGTWPRKDRDQPGSGSEDGQGLSPSDRDEPQKNRWGPGQKRNDLGRSPSWGDRDPGWWGPERGGNQTLPQTNPSRAWKPGKPGEDGRRQVLPGHDYFDADPAQWEPKGVLLGDSPVFTIPRQKGPKQRMPWDQAGSRPGYRPRRQGAGADIDYPDDAGAGRYKQPKKSEKDKSKRASLIASLCPGQSPSKKEIRKNSASSDEGAVTAPEKGSTSGVAPPKAEAGGSMYPGGDMSGVVGEESWIDNKNYFEEIVPPVRQPKDVLKPVAGGIDFSPDFTSTVGRPGKVPPPVPPKNSSFDDSFNRTDMFSSDRDGIQETRVEHKIVLSSADDDEFDYDAALADAIRSVTEFNPDMSVERIECVQQIEEVKGK